MTYEYVCGSCGAEWEAEQAISEAPLKRCPHCKKNAAKRQISGGNGFILKGGGWYADLYGSAKASGKGSGAADQGDTSSSKDAAGAPKSEGGADSKTPTGGGESAASTEPKAEKPTKKAKPAAA